MQAGARVATEKSLDKAQRTPSAHVARFARSIRSVGRRNQRKIEKMANFSKFLATLAALGTLAGVKPGPSDRAHRADHLCTPI